MSLPPSSVPAWLRSVITCVYVCCLCWLDLGIDTKHPSGRRKELFFSIFLPSFLAEYMYNYWQIDWFNGCLTCTNWNLNVVYRWLLAQIIINLFFICFWSCFLPDFILFYFPVWDLTIFASLHGHKMFNFIFNADVIRNHLFPNYPSVEIQISN